MDVSRNLCFTGHRPERLGGRNDAAHFTVAVKAALDRAIRETYSEGFRRFITGMAQGVDTWAAELVISLRNDNPDVKLIAAVPFVTQWYRWDLNDWDRWKSILRAADQVWVTMDGGKR